MYETDQSGHGVEINPLAPDLYIAEQRIIELEAERDKLREALSQSSDDHVDTGKYALRLKRRIKELEAERDKLNHKLTWYETKFKPPVQPPADYWMALLQDKEKSGD